MHARRGSGDIGDILDALRRLQNRVDKDRLFDVMTRLEKGEILIREMDIPIAFDFRDHHDIELIADFSDQTRQIVEKPWRVQSIDARPKASGSEIDVARHGDEAFSGGDLRVDRNCVFKIAKHDVDFARNVSDFGAHLFVMRWY